MGVMVGHFCFESGIGVSEGGERESERASERESVCDADGIRARVKRHTHARA